MAIIARCNDSFDVKVTGSVTVGNVVKFCVEALEGEPFQVNTMGGPMMVDSAIVYREQLSQIRQVWDNGRFPAPKPGPRKSILNGDPVVTPTYHPLEQRLPQGRYNEERASFKSTARGGMNND